VNPDDLRIFGSARRFLAIGANYELMTTGRGLRAGRPGATRELFGAREPAQGECDHYRKTP
jgi:hypothetical protein